MENIKKNYDWLILNLDQLSNHNIVYECTNAPAIASGYIISKKAAKHFLETSNDLFFPVDNVWHYSSGYLKQAFLVDSLIIQTLNDTNIQNRMKQN